jgi:molybdate transport system substrate-binding protein
VLGLITERLLKGEAADVAIVSPAQTKSCRSRAKLLAGSRVEIQGSAFTVFVKKGATKPTSLVDALKRTLLAGKVDRSWDPARGGGAGVYAAGLMQRLGLSEDIKAKTCCSRPAPRLHKRLRKAKPKSEWGGERRGDRSRFSNPSRCRPRSRAIPCMCRISSGSAQPDAAKR